MKIILRIFGVLLLSPVALLIGYKIYTRPPATPHGINAKSGREQAQHDLATGKVRLMEAGTMAVNAPGVSFDNPLYAQLPKLRLPNGCTNPDANKWFKYAAGYNEFMINHLNDRR